MSQASSTRNGPSGAAPATGKKGGNSKAYALMASGTMVSRGLGFLRTALLTYAIGALTLADIFEKANVIPTIIFMLLAGGIFNVVLVPQLIKVSKRADRGSDYTSRLITLTVVVMGAATILLTLLAGPIIKILTLNWSDAELALGTTFTYWCMPQVFFYGVYAVVGQVLNAHGRFGAYMWAPVANNVVQLAVIGTFIGLFGAYDGANRQVEDWTSQQTVLLAGGSTLGIAIQALVLFWPLARTGLGIRPKFGWRGMGLRHVGKLAAWTLSAMAIGNISSLMFSRLVSGATAVRAEMSLVAGASVQGEVQLNITQLITVLPHSIFALSLATVLFNEFTKAFHDNRHQEIAPLLSRGLRSTAVPVVFASIAFIVLAGPLGRIFASSASTANQTGAAIGQLLVLTALGLPFKSISFFLMRVFYAEEDTRTPMIIQSVVAVLGVATAYLLALVVPMTKIAIVIALLFGLMNILSAVIAHVLVVRRYGDYGTGEVADAYIRIGWMSALSGVVGAVVLALMGGYNYGFAWDSIGHAVLSIAISGSCMLVVFLVLLRTARSPELEEFLGPLARRIPSLRRH
ncbi:murein biosynthesis integral membrane protein MurJ [Paeniglutamicibacter cryotolerans]|uniref:Putative peptidoglycan lipid II flippase n=1 Tax=Paeniglutamicibacter cryotolerans TaxID=670079 RepID=A0A839QK41_9MICC|nr:murein biosynthesis integral membrane protein MurJ [Paeniglutamicibacter cryotolerans]MBB2994915.1 putative peptidoglycan lipid II flippase [Paeniglutamicibacter cryotolerans]